VARVVPFVGRLQDNQARFYERELGKVLHILFVNVVGNPHDSNEFIVFVGGDRKYGLEAVNIGTEVSLNAIRSKYLRFAQHRFKISCQIGTLASRFGDAKDRSMHSLRQREDSAVQG